MFSPQVLNGIVAQLGEKVPKIRPCPVCAQEDKFIIGEGLVNVEMSNTTWIMPQGIFATQGPSVASHIALICTNCGNTQLLNIYVLGIAPLIQGVLANAGPTGIANLPIPGIPHVPGAFIPPVVPVEAD